MMGIIKLDFEYLATYFAGGSVSKPAQYLKCAFINFRKNSSIKKQRKTVLMPFRKKPITYISGLPEWYKITEVEQASPDLIAEALAMQAAMR